MISKSENVQAKLKSILKKSKIVSTNDPLKGFRKKDFKEWMENLKELNDEQKTFKEGTSAQITSNMRMVGLGLLAIVAIIIFFGFGYMYWRIKSSLNIKRMI